jgi:hypothetical protein
MSMKKISTKLFAILLVAVPMLFASCDSDPWYYDYWDDDWTWGNDYHHRPDDGHVNDEDFLVSMARTLAGQWRGDMMAYEIDNAGNAIDSIYYKTDIEFKQYNSQSISGTGTQYDFHPDTEELELERDFTWYIDPKSGDIYMTYKEKDSEGVVRDYVMVVAYDDLNLNHRTFTGYLWATDGHEVDDFWFDRYTGTRASVKKNVKKIKFVMK